MYVKHHAIIVTGGGYEKADKVLGQVLDRAKSLFPGFVSDVVASPINCYMSFLVAPDGSKEGVQESDQFDTRRGQLIDFIESLANEDGSNSVTYVEVAYEAMGKGSRASVTRRN